MTSLEIPLAGGNLGPAPPRPDRAARTRQSRTRRRLVDSRGNPTFAKARGDLIFDPGLTNTEFKCLIAIRYHEFNGPGSSRPSNETLIEACNLKPDGPDKGVRAMRRLLNGLVKKGRLRIEKVGRNWDNPTGRLLHLIDRNPGAIPGEPPPSDPPQPDIGALLNGRIPGAHVRFDPGASAPRIDSWRVDENVDVPNDNGSALAGTEDGGTPETIACHPTGSEIAEAAPEAAEAAPGHAGPSLGFPDSPRRGDRTAGILAAPEPAGPRADRGPAEGEPTAGPEAVARTPDRNDVDWREGERLFARYRDRSMILYLEAVEDGGEVTRFRYLPGSVEPIRDEERAELKRSRSQVLAYLRNPTGDPVAVAAPTDVAPTVAVPGQAAGKPAPSVPGPDQARVRKLIVQLHGNADPTIVEEASRAIADALRDHKPESRKTFLGWAGDVRRGRMPEACLLEAFETACGKSIKNRGAAMTDAVRRFRRSEAARRIGPATAGGIHARTP
jgi:hypothetical protein